MMVLGNMLYWILAFVAGAALSLEVALGGVLGKTIGELETSLFIFIVGFVVFLPYVVFKKRESLQCLRGLRKWELCGGFLGAIYLILLLICVTHIGVGTCMAAVIIGQLAMGAILEQFGWINLPVAKCNHNTLLAFIMLAAALILII